MVGSEERGCPTKGVPDRGMSGRENTGRAEVPGGGVKLLEGPGAGKPQGTGSGSVRHDSDIEGMPSPSQVAVATALLM